MRFDLKFWNNLCVVLIMISVIFIAGCTSKDDQDHHPVLFNLRIEKIESRNISDSTVVWDAYISIDEIIYPDNEYPWDTITIKIWQTRNQYEVHSGVHPEKFPYGEDLGDDYHVWYEELTGHPDNMDEIDMIVITGMTEEYEGYFVKIYYRRNIAGSIQLDSDFT